MKLPFPPPLPDRESRSFDVVGLGGNAADHLLVLPRFPEPGQKVRFSRYGSGGGGRTATPMVALARLGFRTRYLGGVGDDADGAANVASLEAEGVDCSGVLVRPGRMTQKAIILIDEKSGERTVLWGRGEGIPIEPEEVRSESIATGRLLFTDGQNPRAAAAAADLAHQAGMPVLADIEDVREGLEELLPRLDILISPASFLPLVAGTSDLALGIARLHEKTAGGLIVVTRGARGATAWIAGEARDFPAYRVNAIDTTGAGDVFHAGFAAACLLGRGLEESIDFANAIAAMSCRGLGGRAALPRTLEEIDRFRQETPRL
ncbi:MAG: carbohydrate kinase family protein [Candidatus Eisenbacteria bacterium]